MPGLVGLITTMPRERAERELLGMLAAVRHEPFYETGTWIDESLGAYVGWTAHKGSFAARMPVRSGCGNISIVLSGEDFPEPGTANRLNGDRAIDGDGPSYLTGLYEAQAEFLPTLNGVFHGIVMDKRRGCVTLFNDRYGMHRVRYHEAKDAFYFAGEAKAIVAVRPELRVADPDALAEFVAYSCVLDDRTIFKHIHVLPHASAWVFTSGSITRKGVYFEPREWEEQPRLAPEPYYARLRDAFSGNLPRYFKGDQRIGIALTGGMDTRAIMAWRTSPPGALPCYTFAGPIRDSQDVRVARKVARLCGEPYDVIRVGAPFLARFPYYAERSIYLTEGGVDVSRSPDLYASEQARNIAPVKIVGTYGSEILRHAVMLTPAVPSPGLYRPDFLACIDRASRPYADLRQQHPVTFAAFRQSPWYHSGVLGLEQSQLTVRSPYLDTEFVRAAYCAPTTGGDDDVRVRLINDGNPALGQVPTDRGIGGRPGLSPLIVRGALEFALKAEYAYDYGMPQWLARLDHAFASFHLERLFLGYHKFSHFRVWYRDSLSDYVRAILLDHQTLSRGYLVPAAVERLVNAHLKGTENHTTEIHKLLTFELLHRLFFNQN